MPFLWYLKNAYAHIITVTFIIVSEYYTYLFMYYSIYCIIVSVSMLLFVYIFYEGKKLTAR